MPMIHDNAKLGDKFLTTENKLAVFLRFAENDVAEYIGFLNKHIKKRRCYQASQFIITDVKSRSESTARTISTTIKIPFQIFLKIAPIFERLLFLPSIKRTLSLLEMEQRLFEPESQVPCTRFSRIIIFVI